MNDSPTVQLQRCLDRLNAGDTAARDELFARAAERLQRLARKMLQDYRGVRRWEETGDIYQDAMLRLHRALQAVSPPTVRDFYRLAALQIRRVLLDLTRHHYGPEGGGKHHASQILRPGESADLPPAYEGQDQSLEAGRLAAWTEFHEQVEALPEDLREVFDLLWYQELSQEEAAALIGVSDRTVRQRWRDARIRLREVLGDTMPSL